MITLRPYQTKAIQKLKSTGINVLSICPGGGKTLTAIQYAINHNFNKILILAHGTNVIKSQWADVFQLLSISFSTDITSSNKFIITIPQSINKKLISEFDLVIVDEAHEFYFADMVKNIFKKIKPKSTLLLTGTPSKFIKAGYSPVIISGVEVYNAGDYLANTYFGLVTSSYKIDLYDFNQEGETTFKFNEQTTNDSLLALVDEMLNRLKINSLIKDKTNIINTLNNIKMNKIQSAFSSLGKTLIAARNIEQANLLIKNLLKNKVNAILSDSESDIDSINVKEFQINKDVQVLVVVKRGILGFNMPELVNVVDFTMSRNIDRIYQLYARVLRTHSNLNKFYFRMCSSLNPAVDAYYLQAAMCLNNPDFISKYNGNNLNSLPIIVPKTKDIKEKSNNKEKSNSKELIVSIDGIMAEQILGLKLLNELIINPSSEYWKEFAYMKFNTVISKLTGKKFMIDYSDIDSLYDGLIEKGLIT